MHFFQVEIANDVRWMRRWVLIGRELRVVDRLMGQTSRLRGAVSHQIENQRGDLAAERGGNCALTKPDEEVEAGTVTILGPTNLPSTVAVHASEMYSRNVSAFLKLIVKDGELHLDFDDEIVRGMCITHGGEIKHEPSRQLYEGRGNS